MSVDLLQKVQGHPVLSYEVLQYKQSACPPLSSIDFIYLLGNSSKITYFKYIVPYINVSNLLYIYFKMFSEIENNNIAK